MSSAVATNPPWPGSTSIGAEAILFS
jgi:hypothetical protein